MIIFRLSKPSWEMAMELYGTFENGVIVLDAGCELSQGERVEILKVMDSEKPTSTLRARMRWMVGAISDLPPDFSREHDHYIHGTPRRASDPE